MRKRRKDRYQQIPQNFLNYLIRNLKGFSDETKEVQLAVVDMILTAPSKYRVHVRQGARFGYEELERRFGRNGFKPINDRLGLFDIEKDEKGRDAWSYKEGRTKAYLFTSKVSDLREKWLKTAHYKPTNLLTEDGDVIRNLPLQAIYSKRITATGIEVTREGWHDYPVEPAVPVNRAKLKQLALHIEKLLYSHEFGVFQDALFHPKPDPEYLDDLLMNVRRFQTHANNRVKTGYIIHRYQQSRSGRLYAVGINLQNAPRPVRQASLHGFYGYDIENCHYQILSQMAYKYGYVCTAINHYLGNKKQVRQQLADEFDISTGQVKQALIALIYGAVFSSRPRDSLPEILGGVELAKRFYAHRLFLGLKDDIKGARSAILKGQKVSRQTIKNSRGLPINLIDENGKEVSDRSLLAHLLQGVESQALECAHKLHPDSIVLLEHDGWTSTKQLDTKALEDAIFEGTGYRFEVVGTAITCNIDDALTDHPEPINPNRVLTDSPLKTPVFVNTNAS